MTGSGLASGSGADSWHELGHAVGLAHVADRGEEMYPSVVPGRPAGWGSGDLAGLAALGGPCPPDGGVLSRPAKAEAIRVDGLASARRSDDTR